MDSPIERREISIQNAVEDVREGAAIAVASRDHHLPRTTLRDRIHGAQDIHAAKENTQRLSPRQEEQLVKWILNEEAAGRPPTRRELMAFAGVIAALGSDDRPIGHNWVTRFLQRHPDIKMKISRGIEAMRSLSSTEDRFRDFWERLDYQIKSKGVGPSRIYNMDETGVAEGETRAGKVIGSSLTKHATRTKGSAGEWVSILECVNASGSRIKPVVVFTGANLQGQWFPAHFPDWAYDCSKSGWSNAKIALKWLEEVFLPQTKPEIGSLWRILILDGSASHTDEKFMYSAWKNNVFLLYLPAHSSHTSHITQPLDVGVFGPLKDQYRQQLAGLVDFTITAPRQKQRFLRAYKTASEVAFSSNNIRAGFRASGIYPTNVDRALGTIVKPRDPEQVPQTPKRPCIEKWKEWWTPRDSKEVKGQVDFLKRDLDGIDRGFRTVATKAGHAIDQRNSLIASLKTENDYLKEKLASAKPSGRKAVKKDPNDTFATMPAVHKARVEAMQVAQRYEERHGVNARDDAEEITQRETEDATITVKLK